MIEEFDKINALFEFSGTLFIGISVYKAWKDKYVAGVSWLSPAFFFVWGLWNLIYYPSLGQWWSFSAGIMLSTMNMIWIGQLIYYNKYGDMKQTSEWKYVDPSHLDIQGLFDASVKHVLEQKKPSVDCKGNCKYRSTDGTQCAASIFISDEEYSEELEGLSFIRVTKEQITNSLICSLTPPNIKFISELQQIHDVDSELENNEWFEGYKVRAKKLADKYNLSKKSFGIMLYFLNTSQYNTCIG
tara:strand:- start:743 stop:1471 length:729 start_codon:yes stop_codon:yes gene_type:complete